MRVLDVENGQEMQDDTVEGLKAAECGVLLPHGGVHARMLNAFMCLGHKTKLMNVNMMHNRVRLGL